MSKGNTNSLTFLSGVVLGAVVGGAMGILFAPAAGTETREKLAKKGKKALKDIKKSAKEVGDKIEPAIENVKKEVTEKFKEVRGGFQKGVNVTRK